MNTTMERQQQTPRRGSQRGLWVAVIAAVATVVAMVAAAAVMLSGNDQTGPSAPNSASAPPSQPTAASSSAGPAASAAPTATQPPAAPFGYQPLWPFSTMAQAQDWQRSSRSGGDSPWHLDADATALAFTTGYLGFAGVNVVVSHSIDGNEALVAVGYPVEGRARPAAAAVLHLAKYGSGADAPWEVVGSKDTTLTLAQPAYGAKVSSPVTVGGRITGVDENIRVQVHQPQSSSPIGDAPGVPAGGEDTPWSTTVSYQGATAPALTIVAWTGGHYTDVERFAITGVRP